MGGVRDDNVQVKCFVHDPGVGGQEKVVEENGKHLTDGLWGVNAKHGMALTNFLWTKYYGPKFITAFKAFKKIF